jgi:hypothetical protein
MHECRTVQGKPKYSKQQICGNPTKDPHLETDLPWVSGFKPWTNSSFVPSAAGASTPALIETHEEASCNNKKQKYKKPGGFYSLRQQALT